jgi:hypothetical protein
LAGADVSLKQNLIIEPAVLSDILQIEESELDNHQLAKTLTEFIKQKEDEDEKVEIDGYKKVDDDYLVHLSGDLEADMFTFASVPVSELAKAMDKQESELQSKMNEKIFGAARSSSRHKKKTPAKEGRSRSSSKEEEQEGNHDLIITELPHPATFAHLIEKGGSVSYVY